MNTDLALQQDTNLDMWHDKQQLEEIKNVYAKGATDTEFKTFVGIGRATGLNPFLRELWFVKFGGKDASIFIGRDGYRKTANRDKNFLRHHVEAVYSKDEFHYDANTGNIHHKYNFSDRGSLFGAYCVVYMRNSVIPYFRFVELSEYDLKQSIWNSKKPTMIMKVAEAQCLRMASPELFGGTYDETEEAHIQQNTKKIASERIDEMISSKVENTKEFREINKIIRNAENLLDLDAVPDLVKKMVDVNNEVQTIRQLYKLKRDRLKEKESFNQQTGEVIDIQEAEIVDTSSEYEKIKKQIEKSKSIDVLDIAGDLIRSLENESERETLSIMYNEKRESMKG